jgi:hypothetical protein
VLIKATVEEVSLEMKNLYTRKAFFATVGLLCLTPMLKAGVGAIMETIATPFSPGQSSSVTVKLDCAPQNPVSVSITSVPPGLSYTGTMTTQTATFSVPSNSNTPLGSILVNVSTPNNPTVSRWTVVVPGI